MTTPAVVIVEKGKAEVQEVPKPSLRNGYVLVKVKAVGINPTDVHNIDSGSADPGSRIGCDYAGVVEEVGENLANPFQKGDRIAGMVHGGDPTQHENGGFASYVIAKADVSLRIPDNLTFEEAATLGVSITTVGQGLYKTLKLPLPSKDQDPVQAAGTQARLPLFIYGGSTATAIFGIQFAKQSGLDVITTASRHNHEYLRSLGADAVFDYKDPACAEHIRAWLAGRKQSLRTAWDCIGNPQSAEICARALADDEEGGTYAGIIPVDRAKLLAVNKNVKGPLFTLGYDVFGEPYKWMFKDREAKPDELEYGRMFWELARGLLERRKIKTIRPTVNRGGDGLEGVLKGLDEVRNGRVSGEKLVYTL
ncbi:chaperonin 10-like protein [Xylariales sp. AK1849]|nr:chaperonin 10-like protein [Xylariales sp. AK1849]